MVEDFDRCYRAMQARDARFDGWFFTAVTTTGIYCRPSCPARTPGRERVRFYPTAAAAQQAGFRGCMRCRPDAVPGSPEWRTRADVVGRAMRLVADGVVDRHGVAGLAERLGYGTRHLHRLLVGEVGAGPLALGRAQRAQTARLLIETTELPMADVAFAAGFSSVRQFNDTVAAVLGRTPSALRATAHGRSAPAVRVGQAPPRPSGAASLDLRLAYRSPIAATETLAFLGARAVAGLERYEDGRYERSLRLPHGQGTVSLHAAPGHIAAHLRLADLRDLPAAVARCRHLLDLDADPEAVDGALADDPALRPLVRATPGRRVPGSVNGFELAARAIVGQQISVAGARTVTARIVDAAGAPLEVGALPGGELTRVFPTPAQLLSLPPSALPLPAARRAALMALARAADGGALDIDAGTDPAELSARLVALPGVGPWTASYVAMRALGDPDAFFASDLGVRRALERLGLASSRSEALVAAARWRPWRSYALVHLWSVGTAVRKEAA